MVLLNSVEPEKWYTAGNVQILGWGVMLLPVDLMTGSSGLIKPGRSGRRPRIYRGARIQGCEIIRFESSSHGLKPERACGRAA